MPAITATAPGKAILLGEHAVVYGQPAIAVPVIQVRARAIITPRPDRPRGWIGIQAPDIGLETILDDLPENDPLSQVIYVVLEITGINRPPACLIRITSTIPIAAGLGSGAAVSVATIRAFSAFLGTPLPDEQVSDLAYEIEKLHHGTPSGIDNSVITYQKPVYYMKTGQGRGSQIQTFHVARPFTIVIGDTGLPSPTSVTVSDVRQAWLENEQLYEQLFKGTGELVKYGRQAIERGDIMELGRLMNENQGLLEKMGVSSDELEKLNTAALQAGAYGAKLSGGGRGGNMIALAGEGDSDEIVAALKSAGATNTLVTEIKGENRLAR